MREKDEIEILSADREGGRKQTQESVVLTLIFHLSKPE